MNENDQTEDLPCPNCPDAMDWHPNGHMASCPSCGHEEIL